VLAAIASLALADGASAQTVTLGSPLTAAFISTQMCPTLCTYAALEVPGAAVTSPTDGTVVTWRVKGSAAGGGFKLQVLHPAGFEAFTGTGTSAEGRPTSAGTQVFPSDLPIKAGDLVGLDNTVATSMIGYAAPPGSKVAFWANTFPDGSTVGPDGSGGPFELAYNVDVRPLPGISSLSPASGPVGGGTSVTIGGHDFTGATAVSFGGAAAASFAVESDTQIAAVSPPGAPGTVDVAVRNPGQSPKVGTDSFTYAACVVPKLTGKKLKAVRKLLKATGCKLGKVKSKKSRKRSKKKLRVKKQGADPGTVLEPGSAINVKVG
jgi:hypothetical protein